MFSNNWLFLIFIGVSMSVSSCKVDPLNDPIIISLIEKEFSLELWENLQNPTVPLEIHFETITDENCLNASILSSYEKNLRDLSLTIYEILEPENCDPGMAPASGLEPIVGVADNGNYPLNIELRNVVINTGALAVTTVFYEVVMNEENGISWKHTKLLRVPSHSLWGYVTYIGAEQLTAANSFVATLQNNTSPFINPDGYYGHFELENNQLISVKAAPVDIESKIFIQTFTGDVEGINNIVDSFRDTAPEGMQLHLYDGKGNIW